MTRYPPSAFTRYPPSDESFCRLHGSGWSIGETAVHGPAGIVWIVSGTNGENVIEARGASQTEAWARAVEQARAVGMLSPEPEQ